MTITHPDASGLAPTSPTKTCSRCHETLPVTRFSKHSRKADGLQPDCKTCQNTRHAAKYAANPGERERITATTKATRQRLRAIARAHLETHPCTRCGQTDISLLGFAHMRGTHEFTIADGVDGQTSEAKLLAGIAKCDVLCVACDPPGLGRRADWSR